MQLQLASFHKLWLFASVALLLLTGLVNPAQATGFYKDFVIANNTYYYTNNNIGYGIQNFQGKDLGTFDRGNGTLTLGGEAATYSDNGDNVQPPQMFYRVYLQGSTTNVPFTPLNLKFLRSGDDGVATNQTWDNRTTNPNLVASTNGPGTYVLEIYYISQATYNNNGYGGNFFLYDSNSGQNYKAYFTVTGNVPAQWNGSQGDSDNSWFVAANWTPNGVPNYATDITIPYITGGVIPKISGTSPVPAQARTLNIIGSTDTPGAINLSQSGGELQVFGDLINANNSYQQTGGALTLAGSTQTFDGGAFFNVNVQGGGRKTLRGRMDILTNLNFSAGVIATRTDNTGLYNIELGVNATISGESESNYVLGILRSRDRVVTQGQPNSFGNIGIQLTTQGGDPGKTLVTRITGPDGFSYKGAGTSQSIRRGFIFQPDNPNGYNFDLALSYLGNELNGIQESNLRLFRSLNGTTPFLNLGITALNQTTNPHSLTRTGLNGTLAATFTLGDAANPLPVTLTSFTATPTAQGAALLRWTTATESNNRGFGIERQLGSNEAWQSVGFVAAGATTGSTYEFTDKSLATAVASKQAYYRLRQEDLTGTATYSPVAVINRMAVVAAIELTLSPVPVSGSDNLSVGLAEAGQAGIAIAITNAQGQRMLSFTTQASTDAALSLSVTNLAAGVYIVTVQVPGQAARHARFVKI